MAVTSLPVGVFAPDTEIVDSPSLQDVKNLLPIFGSWRLIPKPQLISSLAGNSDPITGGHVHLLNSSQAYQFLRPIVDANHGQAPEDIVDQDGNTPDVGAEDGVYRSIDEKSPDRSDYIVTAVDDSGRQWYYACDLTAIADPGVAGTASNHVIRFEYKSTVANDITVLLNTVGDGAIAGVTVAAGASDDWTVVEHAIAAAEADAITDWSNIWLSFSGTSFVPTITTFDPDETLGNSGGFETDDSAEDLHNHIGDPGDDAEYIATPSMTAGGFRFCSVGLPDIVDPASNTDHTIRLRARFVSTDAADVTIRLKQDDDIIVSNTFTLTGSFATQTFAIPEATAANITDHSQLSLVIKAENTGSSAGHVEISALEFDCPQYGQQFISWAEFQVPTASAAEYVDADVNYQYVGTKENLYEIDSLGQWDEVTRAASDYGQGDPPGSWDFCSWGEDVIATNYVDEVQVKTPGNDFTDLISSPAADEYEVRGRYCAVVNNFLVLANLNNHAASGAGGTGTVGDDIANPHTVWWSAINDNDTFKLIDLSTQSDYQPLLDTPGGITGLTGGPNYGLIFKPNSIYRMDYVGSDLFFAFSQVSSGDGTLFPRSIVQAERDVYFLGASGIQVVRDGQAVQDIGDGQITRWLMDGRNNDEALMQESDPDITKVHSQIFGDYNPSTRCITWWYSPANPGTFLGPRRGLVFNLVENRFSKLNLESELGLSTTHYIDHYMCAKNSLVSAGPITKLDQLYVWDETNSNHRLMHLNDKYHTEATFQSSIISSKAVTGNNFPMNIQINRVRPIFRLESGTDPYPNISFSITSSDDPELRDSVSSTCSYRDRDEDGWYSLPELHAGEYFQFDTTIASTSSQFRYFVEWQIDWQVQGEF